MKATRKNNEELLFLPWICIDEVGSALCCSKNKQTKKTTRVDTKKKSNPQREFSVLEKCLFIGRIPHDRAGAVCSQVIEEKIQIQNGAFRMKHLFHGPSLSFKVTIEGFW